jgi:hypothetical protein
MGVQMPDNINNYTFDFETEAEALRLLVGPDADNIIFVETTVFPPESKGGSPRIRTLPVGDTQFMRAHWEETFYLVLKNYNGKSETATLSRGNIDIGHRVSIVENEAAIESLGKKNKDLMRLWILYHETGHALIPGHDVDNNHPFRESAADAFAALLFLQRFGPEAKDFLSKMSWNRAFEAVRGDTSHLTTFVLDKIIADSAHEDFYNLSLAETIKLAETYAKKWTPKIKTLSAIRGFFRRSKSQRYSETLQECLASPSAPIAYIGARFFQPFLKPNGAVLNGVKLQLDRTARREFAAAIKEHTTKTTLHDMFRKAKGTEAQTSLANLLKSGHSRSRSRFTANF